MRWILVITSVLLGCVGQLLMKKGVSILGELNLVTLKGLLCTFSNKYVFFGFFSYGISSIIWLSVLSKFPLSTAYPLLSLGYVFVIIFSWIFFKETLTIFKIVGVLSICLGVFFISISG